MMTGAETSVFSIESIGDVLVVSPQGTSQAFRYNDIHRETNALNDRMRRDGCEHLIIDFSNVEILCSIMINAIIRIARQHQSQKGTAAFCEASPTMCDVIQSMNLTRLWPYYQSRQDAIASFNA